MRSGELSYGLIFWSWSVDVLVQEWLPHLGHPCFVLALLHRSKSSLDAIDCIHFYQW